jgi:hypothetical protein
MISKTNELLQEYGGNLFILNVVKNEFNFDSARNRGAGVPVRDSQKAGANLSVLQSDDIRERSQNIPRKMTSTAS